MHHVYILQSIKFPDWFYTGLTTDLERRLGEHNSGQSIHTNKFKPWRIMTTVSFDNKCKAEAYEKYLKTSSGRAFAKKRL